MSLFSSLRPSISHLTSLHLGSFSKLVIYDKLLSYSVKIKWLNTKCIVSSYLGGGRDRERIMKDSEEQKLYTLNDFFYSIWEFISSCYFLDTSAVQLVCKYLEDKQKPVWGLTAWNSQVTPKHNSRKTYYVSGVVLEYILEFISVHWNGLERLGKRSLASWLLQRREIFPL